MHLRLECTIHDNIKHKFAIVCGDINFATILLVKFCICMYMHACMLQAKHNMRLSNCILPETREIKSITASVCIN